MDSFVYKSCSKHRGNLPCEYRRCGRSSFYTCKVTNIVDGFSYSTSYRYNIKISAEALDAPKVSIAPKIITCDFGKEATPLKVELKDAALGVQFHYQWYSNTVNDNSNGQLLQGETKSSLIVPTNTVGTTWYYCVVYKVFDGKQARPQQRSVRRSQLILGKPI